MEKKKKGKYLYRPTEQGGKGRVKVCSEQVVRTLKCTFGILVLVLVVLVEPRKDEPEP